MLQWATGQEGSCNPLVFTFPLWSLPKAPAVPREAGLLLLMHGDEWGTQQWEATWFLSAVSLSQSTTHRALAGWQPPAIAVLCLWADNLGVLRYIYTLIKCQEPKPQSYLSYWVQITKSCSTQAYISSTMMAQILQLLHQPLKLCAHSSLHCLSCLLSILLHDVTMH